MSNCKHPISRATRTSGVLAVVAATLAALFSFNVERAGATSWSGVEPLVSKRADVVRALGQPVEEGRGAETTLKFKVAGGVVTVAFVDAKFVANKKLSPDVEGTVLQIVLQHENSTITPESMNLKGKDGFEREDRKGGQTVYRNLRDGLAYTFLNGKLQTTRYMPSAEQYGKARVK